jgi:BON domain
VLGTNEVPRPASPFVARMKVPRSRDSANVAESAREGARRPSPVRPALRARDPHGRSRPGNQHDVVSEQRPEPLEYICERIRHALANDPRTAELGVTVTDLHGVLVLSGTVASHARRNEIAAVAQEAASGRELSNDIAVGELTPPTQVEPL